MLVINIAAIIGLISMIIVIVYWVMFIKTNDLNYASLCLIFAIITLMCIGVMMLGI